MPHFLLLQSVEPALPIIVLRYIGVDRKNSTKLILKCIIHMFKRFVDAVMS